MRGNQQQQEYPVKLAAHLHRMLTVNLGITPRSPRVDPSTCAIWRKISQAKRLKEMRRLALKPHHAVSLVFERQP